jgi:hypothetical protein
MSIHDEMSDPDVLRAAAGSLSGLPVARPRMWRRSRPEARACRHRLPQSRACRDRRRRGYRAGADPHRRPRPGPGPTPGTIRTTTFARQQLQRHSR